jgi:hypothetical protein
MKKILLLLFLFNLAANAQIKPKSLKIGSLKVDDKELATLRKYKDHYLFEFIGIGDYHESFEFDINDFDKLYQVFTKENDLGKAQDSYSLSLPLPYLGDDTPKLIILYPSKNEKVFPVYHYSHKTRNINVEDQRREAADVNPNDCVNCEIDIPNFSKEEWNKIFGK